MNDRQIGEARQQRLHNLRHHFIQHPSTLAAAEYQQSKWPRSLRRDLKKLSPHRNPRNPSIPEVARRRSEIDRSRTHKHTHQPIRQPRYRIRLKRHSWDAQQNRGHHRRPTRVPANADHHLRTKATQQRDASQNPQRKISHRPQPRHQTGQMLAGLLNWPQGCFVSKITSNCASNMNIQVEREIDGGIEILNINLPAVITMELQPNEPKYISLNQLTLIKFNSRLDLLFLHIK